MNKAREFWKLLFMLKAFQWFWSKEQVMLAALNIMDCSSLLGKDTEFCMRLLVIAPTKVKDPCGWGGRKLDASS